MASLTDIYNSILSAVGALNVGVTNMNTAVGDISGLSSNIATLLSEITTVSSTFMQISTNVAFIAANFASLIQSPIVLPGYISGLTLSNSTTTTKLNFAAGVATDSSGFIYMKSTVPLLKASSHAWVAGNNVGMMGSGLTFTSSTWYHLFLISSSTLAIGQTSAYDFYADTSVTAANIPSSMSYFRRVGSMKSSTSAVAWQPFTQLGDEFLWKTALHDLATTGSTATTNTTVTVPPGVQVYALMTAYNVWLGSGGGGPIWFFSPDIGTQAIVATGPLTAAVTTGTLQGSVISVRTNTSAQVAWTSAATSANNSIDVWTYGWLDPRGTEGI